MARLAIRSIPNDAATAILREKQNLIYDHIIKYSLPEEAKANMQRPPYILELNKKYKELMGKRKREK